MRGDDLEFVVCGHMDFFDHGAVNDLTNRFAKACGMLFSMVDSDERHALLSDEIHGSGQSIPQGLADRRRVLGDSP
jgi:hypothetical protein